MKISLAVAVLPRLSFPSVESLFVGQDSTVEHMWSLFFRPLALWCLFFCLGGIPNFQIFYASFSVGLAVVRAVGHGGTDPIFSLLFS